MSPHTKPARPALKHSLRVAGKTRNVFIWVVILCLSFTVAMAAETFTIKRGDYQVSFALEGFTKLGSRGGEHPVDTFENEKRKLKLNVSSRDWKEPEEGLANDSFKTQRRRLEQDRYSHNVYEVEIPGAERALKYQTTRPFKGAKVVIYTDEMMIEFLFTGDEEQFGSALDELVNSARLESEKDD